MPEDKFLRRLRACVGRACVGRACVDKERFKIMKTIGFLFQGGALFDSLTVQDNGRACVGRAFGGRACVGRARVVVVLVYWEGKCRKVNCQSAKFF